VEITKHKTSSSLESSYEDMAASTQQPQQEREQPLDKESLSLTRYKLAVTMTVDKWLESLLKQQDIVVNSGQSNDHGGQGEFALGAG
jgi:Na+/glutamate symporter